MCVVYRVSYKREPINNVLTGGAVYRVVDCYPTKPNENCVHRFSQNKWSILLCEPRRVGTIINPRAALFN